MLDRKEVERLKRSYPEGTPIRLFQMVGESSLPFGTTGKVKRVDDIGQIHVAWETGSSLALDPAVDAFEVIAQEEIISDQKCGEFIGKVNEVLETTDLGRLNVSCNSRDAGYAQDTLLKLHHAFEAVYGEGYVNEKYGMTVMPAVVRGRNTDIYGLALVCIDLESSGEHYGTVFLSQMGVIDQQSEKLTDGQREFLRKNFIPYDYWYTPLVEHDIHVDFTTMSEQAASIRRKVDELLVTGQEPEMEGQSGGQILFE